MPNCSKERDLQRVILIHGDNHADNFKSDDDTRVTEERGMNLADLYPFASQMSTLSLNVGLETGARAKTFTTTLAHCLLPICLV